MELLLELVYVDSAFDQGDFFTLLDPLVAQILRRLRPLNDNLKASTAVHGLRRWDHFSFVTAKATLDKVDLVCKLFLVEG